MNVLQNMTALTGAKLTDQVIASDMLAASKMGAIQLTMATMESATPELRTFFQNSLNQCLTDHQRLSAMAEQRGWYRAYATPEQQLQLEVQMSEPIMQAMQSNQANSPTMAPQQ